MLDILRHIRSDISKLNRRAVFAFVYAAVGLTCISYLKNPWYLQKLLSATPLSHIGNEVVKATNNNLYALVWWVAVSVFFYFVVPAVIVRFIQKRPLSEIGLAYRIEPGFLKLLAVCILLMLPLTYLMSLTSGFSSKYPFLQVYDNAPYLSTTLLIWELVYFLQFFGLEFFFRGFMVHSLKPSLGFYSIFAMTVPYTMIHFQKPMAETFAAVCAGIFLGWISYRNGTIWLGLVLHCTVAFSMDILALWNKGLI
ncbi:MAG: CPBP family intramembrane metalloprotease [Chloracidobacterium sp.]|nr:CPBP family intramembrane metalloprotease [Chloracidobacterium sp.]